jgi:N-methylhydantoinase A
MRYRGQGHEVSVALPVRVYHDGDGGAFATAFEAAYRALYSRIIPGVEIEVVSWVLSLSAEVEMVTETAHPVKPYVADPLAQRSLVDPSDEATEAALYRRDELRPGARICGPAIITEDETSTVVGAAFEAEVNGFGYIELRRRADHRL